MCICKYHTVILTNWTMTCVPMQYSYYAGFGQENIASVRLQLAALSIAKCKNCQQIWSYRRLFLSDLTWYPSSLPFPLPPSLLLVFLLLLPLKNKFLISYSQSIILVSWFDYSSSPFQITPVSHACPFDFLYHFLFGFQSSFIIYLHFNKLARTVIYFTAQHLAK